jgi:hypothetical protein
MGSAEVLAPLEQRWRGELRGVSLVAELSPEEADVRACLRALGRIYLDSDPQEQDYYLTRRYPASVLVGLAGIGNVGYESGTYWKAVWDAAGVIPRQSDSSRWGTAFQGNLDRFGLARFDGPQKYVTEILMHSGIPDYCLGDLLQLLLHRQAHDPSVTAAELHAWATAPGRESRLANVDKPVVRFIRDGGEYAEDFLDRILDLLDRLREMQFDGQGLHLPARVIDRARSLAESGCLDLTRTRRVSSGRGTDADRPRIVLEPHGRGVYVRLPAIGEAPDGTATWSLNIDGVPKLARSRSLWAGASEGAPSTSVVLDRPARSVRIQLQGSLLVNDLDLVDPATPLLIFGEDGLAIAAATTLPAEPVWLLYPQPEAAGPQPVEWQGEPGELQEVPAPHGWAAWTLRLVDLSKVTALRWAGGPWRSVRASRRPRLDLAAPLAGVCTVYDTPVYGSAPVLHLPSDPEGATTWSVRIQRPDAGTALYAREQRVEADVAIDPWMGLPRPLMGPYQIVVRGPLGRGRRWSLEFAEGLHFDTEPRWRDMSVRGLAAARLEAHTIGVGPSNTRLSVEPNECRLRPTEAAAQFTVSGPDCTEILRVTPPHMAVAKIIAGRPGARSIRPVPVDTEDLPDTALDVSLPNDVYAELVVRHGEQDHQRLRPAAGGRDNTRFELAALADTIERLGSAGLELDVAGVRLPVARCAPRRLARAVHLDGDNLVLEADTALDDMVAGVYQVYAPWAEPVIVPINLDLHSPTLPDRLLDGGPLFVQLRLEDPWVPEPWPSWPGQINSFAVNAIPFVDGDANDPEEQLRSALAGRPLGAIVPGAGEVGMRLYPRAADARRAGAQGDIRGLAAAAVAADPDETLHALTRGVIPARDAVAPMIAAGFALLPVRRFVCDAEELTLWDTCPMGALIACAHRVADADSELREQIASRCGASALDLLDGKPDPFPRVPTFVGSAELLAQLPVEQLDSLWRAATVVPQGALDADTRMAAARELFDSRKRASLVEIAASAPVRIRELRLLLGPRRIPVAPLVPTVDHPPWMRECLGILDRRGAEPRVRELALSVLGDYAALPPVTAVGAALRAARAIDANTPVALKAQPVPAGVDVGAVAAIDARCSATERSWGRSDAWALLPALSVGLAFASRFAAHGDALAETFARQHLEAHTTLARHAPGLVTADLLLAELTLAGVAR